MGFGWGVKKELALPVRVAGRVVVSLFYSSRVGCWFVATFLVFDNFGFSTGFFLQKGKGL